MKTPSNPPSNDKGKPLTARRQKILELAMAQLKKTRAQMDPAVLGKIRSIIANNPKVMKGLGLDEMPTEEAPRKVEVKPSSKSSVVKSSPVPSKAQKIKKALERKKGRSVSQQPFDKELKEGEANSVPQSLNEDAEKIDQAHNMEVMAKLMQLKPNEVENIKAILLKGKD